jgi:hypothetical protein
MPPAPFIGFRGEDAAASDGSVAPKDSKAASTRLTPRLSATASIALLSEPSPHRFHSTIAKEPFLGLYFLHL